MITVKESAERLELEHVRQDLEFRTTVTTAMLSTLDMEQILYVILCGITSGDGLGFNRAFLFLDDDGGRSLKASIALGPSSRSEAEKIWDKIKRDNLTLPALLSRYQAYRQEQQRQQLTQKMASFALPLQDLEALALSPQALMVRTRTQLVAALARCLVSRTPFASNGMVLLQEVGGPGGELMEFHKVAMVPLIVADKLIGAILADNIYTEKDVSSTNLGRLYALGNLAALAIDRARLHAKTVAMAEVDGLTGVYNRRFYQRELERILAATRRANQELSIVVFDLDHFKGYNDTYGHLVGDQLLKDVARLLSQNIRQSDMIARYGGEEFVVLLSDTSSAVAAQVAEKLRQVIKQASLADERIRGLTLSAGVASTHGAESAEALFDRADRALYQAKAGGRDQVVVWQQPAA